MDERTEILLNACRKDFGFFAQRFFHVVEPGVPFEHNWHIDCIAEHLESVERGELPKLIINLPFRSLKTYLVSVAFPAWVFGRKATSKFIVTTYGSDLAKDMSQKCRAIVKSDLFKMVFPNTVVSSVQDEKMDWQTTEHGRYYAVGMEGAITGVGTEYLLIDDPIKPDEAYSDAVRKSANERIRNTLFSRFNDPRLSRFVMVMQRLHEDDPTGHLMKDGGYHLLKLPAEAKSHVSISLGAKKWEMEPGELLFPKRLTREVLDRFRLDMTELNYAAQLQQEPIPIGGGEFKDEWHQFYARNGVKPKEMNVYMMVDAAGGVEVNRKKKKNSDWTVMAVVGLAPDNNYYLLDMIRDRLNPTERVDMLFILHKKWNELCGRAPKVGYERYGMMTDTHYIKEKMNQDGYRFPLVELGGLMAKEERIRRIIPDMQKLRWYFPEEMLYTDIEGRKFNLVHEMIEGEMRSFPKSRYDDILDAITRIYDSDLRADFPRVKMKSAYKDMATRNDSSNWLNW